MPGHCLDKEHLVELEGLEPSSKRGTNELSTCLFLSWFSSRGRLRTANRDLILCCFGLFARLSEPYSRFSCTALSISLGKRTIGRCLVSATVAEIKRHLLYFDYAARAYCFSPFEIVMSQIKERSHHCSACLHTTSTRCQNRSTPFLKSRGRCDIVIDKDTDLFLNDKTKIEKLSKLIVFTLLF